MTSESDKPKTIMTRNGVELCYETFTKKSGQIYFLLFFGLPGPRFDIRMLRYRSARKAK